MVVGDPNVGKSSLMNKYYIRRSNNKAVEVLNNKAVEIKMVEIEPPVPFTNWSGFVRGYTREQVVRHCFVTDWNNIQSSNTIIITFDLTNRTSFEYIKKWLDKCHSSGYYKSFILVGTKSDLTAERVVAASEVQAFITSTDSYNRIATYLEVSSKNSINIDRVYQAATRIATHPSFGEAEFLRESLIKDLEKYITRIESHKLNGSSELKPDFSHGFWVSKNSRAQNREANYLLAKHLLAELESDVSPSMVFDGLESKREKIMNDNNLFFTPNLPNHGINSAELNRIINRVKYNTDNSIGYY